jgi:hypothetical protein
VRVERTRERTSVVVAPAVADDQTTVELEWATEGLG